MVGLQSASIPDPMRSPAPHPPGGRQATHKPPLMSQLPYLHGACSYSKQGLHMVSIFVAALIPSGSHTQHSHALFKYISVNRRIRA